MAEILYSVSPTLHRMVRLEKGEVVELDFEIPEISPSILGGIFMGRVLEVQKPLRAAFVDIGKTNPGIIPLREGRLPSLKQGDTVLVQVSRTENPLEDKGVRLTRLVTLSLGSLLYTPFTQRLSFSKRLKDREAFKKAIDIRPEEGMIVRHWGSLKDPLQKQLSHLRREWEEIQKQLTTKPPACILSPPDLLTRILRSLGPSDTLVIDDVRLSARAKGLARYSRESAFNEKCEEAWDSLLSQEILLPQGGTLYIEETRGLVVIDVNSQGALRHALPFNRQAVREAFRQIRLRDLAGKIVIDLIESSKDTKSLLNHHDIPSELEIWGISPMGLLEMTRRKRRLSVPQRLKLRLN